MAPDKNTFLTTNKQDFKWPYPKPMAARPSEPSQRTKSNNFFVATLVEPYCHCDAHLYQPELGNYKNLAQKERKLYEELAALSKQMSVHSNNALDHPCDDDDEKMESIYQTDFNKRGLAANDYRKLMPAIDSPVGVPGPSETIGLKPGYRDPTRFRYSCFIKPFVGVCPQISFCRTPTLIDDWFMPRTGVSEYQDTISRIGSDIVKSSQQYAEPLPSSRRRIT